MQIDLNDEFKKALDLLENTKTNLFITGKAGSGKSTLLKYFREHTKKNVVVLAPTGVAAVNITGQTIHSFCRFKPDITLEKVQKVNSSLYKKIDTLIIDEISMVRADLLDCVDKFLRINGPKKELPFGGIQVVFIGDLYQLPPVVTNDEKEIFTKLYQSPYFFDAHIFPDLQMELIELEKIYRQRDSLFIELLNGIRNNSILEDQLEEVNKRIDLSFVPNDDQFFIYLTTTNKLSEEINQERLMRLKGKPLSFAGKLRGRFEDKSLPTDLDLVVKIGAQVMLVNNDSEGRWVNGTLGKIVDVDFDDKDDPGLLVELTDGTIVDVSHYTWESFRYFFDEEKNSLQSETTGSFTQFPIKLAWSVTIHKSQGKTFDRVIIDIGSGTFAHGQMYVALSRCTSLEGIILKKAVLKRHMMVDFRVVKFMTKYRYDLSNRTVPLDEKVNKLQEAINNKFSLEIVYLKANDEKSKRIFSPENLGEMEYLGKTFLGVSGFDQKRGEQRTFRVDRILEIKNT